MAEHTPGPWEISTRHRRRRVEVSTQDGKSVGRVWALDLTLAEAEANARLIAAAPEMLEVLEWLKRDNWLHPKVLPVVEATIAKAKGGRGMNWGENKTQWGRHPLSAIWGDIPPEEFAELVESVKAEHGVIDYVIKTYEDQILDGWNRYRAAVEASKVASLVFSEYTGSNPVAYVIARNAQRRQLNAGQRAIAVQRCYEWANPGNPQFLSTKELEQPTADEVARQAQVSTSTVENVRSAIRGGLGDEVASGRMSASAAAEATRAPEPQPNRLTKVQQLQFELGELKDKLEDMEEQIRFYKGEASDLDHEREAMFSRQQEQIRTLNAQVRTWQTRHGEEKRRAGYWEQQAKALGWEQGK